MEMTEKPIKQLYFKYLIAAFGSALVGAIYTLVDMAVIRQYAGPTGTAAIALSNLISVCIMLTHFLKKKNTLRLVKPERLLHTCGRILAIGFSVFFVDLAMGIMTMLYNKRILQLLNNDALSVFGAIATLVTVVLMWHLTQKLEASS